MIIGEAFGEREAQEGKPFVGPSGWELDKMLAQAGLSRANAFVTNVVNKRPPANKIEEWLRPKPLKKAPLGWTMWNGGMVIQHCEEELARLQQEIERVQPKVIIAFGNTALWALTGLDGVMKWRGSVLRTREGWPPAIVIPTYHPAYVLRMWEVRTTAISDMGRARAALDGRLIEPLRVGTIRPSWEQTRQYMNMLWALARKGPFDIVIDLEIKHRRILCFNISIDDTACFCLPIRYSEGWYWSPEEHTTIITSLYLLLHEPNVRLCNQNVGFDIQFMWYDLGLWPKAHYDTMLAQNLLYPSGGTDAGEIGGAKKTKGKLKSLDYLASMWCPWYVYWKDDGKFWVQDVSDDDLWKYGCKDGWYTFEVMVAQRKTIERLGLTAQMAIQMDTLNAAITMMHRGVLVDAAQKKAIGREVEALILDTLKEVEYMATRSLWAEKGFSNVKLKEFFYDELRQVPVLDKLTRQPKCDDEALNKIKKRTPWLTPVVNRILTIRSYQTVLKVTNARTNSAGRWCTAYNVAGTLTHRFSSSENIFDEATNMQNLTLGKEIGK